MTQGTSALRATPRGLLLAVKVTPKASRAEIPGVRDGEVQVRVTVVPEAGKANAAVLALLAKAAGVPKSAFDLVAGETSRHKQFRIASHGEAVQAWLEGLTTE